MSPHATPFIRLLLPFASGIALGGIVDRPLPGLGWGLIAGVMPALWLWRRQIPYRYRWVFGAYIALYGFTGGYFHAVEHNERRDSDHFAHITDTCRVFTGMVNESPVPGNRLKVVFRIDSAGVSPVHLQAAVGSVLLFLKPDSAISALRYGDRLRVRAAAAPVAAPQNPHAFDYRRYLHFQNIHFQAFPQTDSVQWLASGGGHWWWRAAYCCRDRLLSLLHRHFPDPDLYAVASALLLGYKEDLSDELRAAYVATGSMHALAVSGSHVSMLYAGLWFFLGRIQLRGSAGRFLPVLIALLGIWAFSFLTGATASVLRASVMFTIYLIGKAAWRENNGWNVLAASAFLLLAFNPYYLFDAGFQLSYAAVGGMVFFYPRLYRRAPVWDSRIANWLLQAFIVGCAAQLGTLPLSLYYFHQFPLYFWIAGWVVLLIGGVFMIGGTALIMLDFCWQPGADCVAWILRGLLWVLNRLIVAIQHLPGSVLEGIWIGAGAAALLYLAIFFTGAALAFYQPRWYWPALGILAGLGVGRILETGELANQRTLVVYHTPRHSLVDCFDGFQRITLSDSLALKQENAAAQGHRWACSIVETAQRWRLDSVGKDSVELRAPLVFQFNGHTIALISRKVSPAESGPPPALARVDLLILSGNPLTDLASWRPLLVDGGRVVFDASNSRRNIRQWRNYCETAKLPYWDVTEKGALVLPLGDSPPDRSENLAQKGQE